MKARGVGARAGLVSLLGLLYASTCAGPYGTEDFVALVGPGLFLLLLFVTPWLWGVPTALATAELASKRPVAGGYYRWAREYLGDFWAYQQGMWNLIASFLDNALYPVLFARAVAHMAGGLSRTEEWLVACSLISLLTWLNYRGIEIAGVAATALDAFLVAPLIWLVGAALFDWRFSPIQPFAAPGIEPAAGVGACLALSMWLYSGYFEFSAAAAEIEDPARNVPRALLLITPLVIASYALPTIAGLAAVGGWEAWESGQFASMGRDLGGPLLGYWLFLGSVASQSVVFLAYLVWWSRLAWTMAQDGLLPASLTAVHSRFGTPHRVLLLYGLVYCAMAAVPFEALLVAVMWIDGASNLVLQLSLVKSREVAPGAGSFRVPGGRVGLWLNVSLPLLTWLTLLVLTARDHVLLGGAALALPTLLYRLTGAATRTQLAEAR